MSNNDDDDDDDNNADNDGSGVVDRSLTVSRLPFFLRFRLKTRSTIPFGWLINFGRLALFLLFFPGGALSALLSEGVGVEALMKLPYLLLSLLSSELAQ